MNYEYEKTSVIPLNDLYAYVVIIIPQSITASAEETQNATVINAADYGVTPEAQDNAESIKALISAAKAVDGPVVISFPKG